VGYSQLALVFLRELNRSFTDSERLSGRNWPARAKELSPRAAPLSAALWSVVIQNGALVDREDRRSVSTMHSVWGR
jgi:hypothetical protein